MSKKVCLAISLAIAGVMIFTACGSAATATPAPAATATSAPVATATSAPAVTATPAPTATPSAPTAITMWTKFNDLDPQNEQDTWMAEFIAHVLAEKNIAITNVNEPYDQINSKLALAVNAGGQVPDLSYVDAQYLSLFINNGTLTDITSFVKSAPWYSDVAPSSWQTCTGPDGKIYCVPTNVSSTLDYYWTAAYPNGAPADSDALLAAAAALPKGKFPISLKASDAVSVEQSYDGLVQSIGGQLADASGKADWANPQTVQVVTFLRQLFSKGYAPQADLATGFDDETFYTDGSAGLFMAGSWSYVYFYPLTSFDGKNKYNDNGGSVEQALQAGDMGIAAPLTMTGGKPVAIITDSALAIPAGATKNLAAAEAVINYQMQPEQDADFAVSYGALPSNTKSLSDPRIKNSTYWQQNEKIVAQYGVPASVWVNSDKAMQKLAETITTLIEQPNLDIMTTLKAAQDDINSGGS